jgi:hypothetical protein
MALKSGVTAALGNVDILVHSGHEVDPYFSVPMPNHPFWMFWSYPVPRKRERSLHTCAQDVQITRIVTI